MKKSIKKQVLEGIDKSFELRKNRIYCIKCKGFVNDVPHELEEKDIFIAIDLTTQKICEMIIGLIKTREGSIQYNVNDYEEIFSINDLKELLTKIRGDGE